MAWRGRESNPRARGFAVWHAVRAARCIGRKYRDAWAGTTGTTAWPRQKDAAGGRFGAPTSSHTRPNEAHPEPRDAPRAAARHLQHQHLKDYDDRDDDGTVSDRDSRPGDWN